MTSREEGKEEKQQMKRGAGLSAITCAGVTRAGLSREIPPLHSKAGEEGAQRLISESRGAGFGSCSSEARLVLVSCAPWLGSLLGTPAGGLLQLPFLVTG